MGLDTVTVFPSSALHRSPREHGAIVAVWSGMRSGSVPLPSRLSSEPAGTSAPERVARFLVRPVAHSARIPGQSGSLVPPINSCRWWRVTAILVSAARLSPALCRHSSCIRKMLRLAG
jgi:hypothetical protein